ncbi:hypothetical protein CIPAW_09G139700 [Carya illinoinensis]|uniref:Uncharacterized protein n=1 Tax=Carya illinoinensis TaxID=32201 RepID=A0A8T1PLM2_CARIL|nr:hypothetical protein CIPAW_09G139700 [Carya illinoinensis]
MPSSISCLVSLQFDDHYFLASSMDGLVGRTANYGSGVSRLGNCSEDKFSNLVPSTVCWHRAERLLGVQDETQWYKECIHQQVYGLKVWLGSHKGLFCMDWSGIYSDALM